MADEKEKKKSNSSSPALKRSWFQELKLEFGKITWPDKQRLTRESIVVVISSVALGFIIAGVDFLIKIGLTYIVG